MNSKLLKTLCFFSILIFVCFSTNVIGQAGVPAAVNVHDYFKVGEMGWATMYFDYWTAIAANAQDRINEHRTLLSKIGASPKTLAAFDTFTGFVTTLPLASGWSGLTEEQKTKWRDDQGWLNFWNALKADITANPQADFFLWFGYDTLRFSWTIAKWKGDGWTVADMLPTVKAGIEEFVWFGNHAAFKSLTPEVQTSVKTIASLQSKLNPDPLSGASGPQITVADIGQAVDAANAIRQAARNNKLVP